MSPPLLAQEPYSPSVAGSALNGPGRLAVGVAVRNRKPEPFNLVRPRSSERGARRTSKRRFSPGPSPSHTDSVLSPSGPGRPIKNEFASVTLGPVKKTAWNFIDN
ncbi:hypothetical protein HD554DRAFT_2037268 [Boletus coccyginus]|nr:hypothetical protein HD554DRAFT_2037268 [Boletus coccyginus]